MLQSVHPSVPCLQFTQNQRAVETSILWWYDLDTINWLSKFEVKRSKVKVTRIENVTIVFRAYLCKHWIDLHQVKSKWTSTVSTHCFKYYISLARVRKILLRYLSVCLSHTFRSLRIATRRKFIFARFSITRMNCEIILRPKGQCYFCSVYR